MDAIPTLPIVGVSRCLLGDPVRYDGASKPSDIVMDELAKRFDLVPVCPEVEAGLGVPRPPVQLTGDIEAPLMTGRDDAALDVTMPVESWCEARLPQLAGLSGFVCKSRSPSCGFGTTPLFVDGECVTETADGVFVRHLRRHYPAIAIIDELGLADAVLRRQFITQVRGAHEAKQEP